MKSLLLYPLLLVLVFFSNCKKEITQVVQPNITILKTLQPDDWKYDAASNTYYVDIPVPEIDDHVVQTNGVLSYMTFNTTDIRYESLPDVLDGSTIVCFYEKGLYIIEIQGSDGSMVAPPSAAIGLKIVLVNSDIR
ncbi:hypothetical protein SAMN05428949_6487 [Chitinophaga sp. YR627]|uniref:hypothetical protein n=1 Tax=Chitinophaga sp. YR627 TaxID=1881041 RepID=UPI0008F2440C|nr:hypothetical protein [Chitinophaga sp. YR627]SFO75413.1 hypothetical protein SAMN05428949_6487 [Chitinophaga sp. YR627]